MPYSDGFNHEEKLKLAMLWGKHENYDHVRWEFAKFYEINCKPSLIPPRERRDEFVFQQDGARCHTTEGVRQWLAEQFGVVISGLSWRSGLGRPTPQT